MRIALIASSLRPLPARFRGSEETLVADLAAGLVELGHTVTTFATGDSRVAGVLQGRFAHAATDADAYRDLAHANQACREVRHAQPAFDVVHAHLPAALPFSRFIDAPMVYTVHHARLDGMVQFYEEFAQVGYVMLSARQRDLQPEVPDVRVIQPGLDATLYPLGDGSGGYVAFVGELSREIAPHLAIDAARVAGVPLLMAGRAPAVDHAYFEDEVEPRLTLPGIERLEDVGLAKKLEVLGRARAVLMPLEWDEPSGLALIEAMLCGTPVVAFARGAAVEVIENGHTGFVVGSVEEMATAIRAAITLDRTQVRARAIARFGHVRMAREHVEAYAAAIERHRADGGRSSYVTIANTAAGRS